MLSDVVAILASTPEKLKREIASMSLQEMKTRPAADKWSVQEVLAHLDDIEEIGMRARVVAMNRSSATSVCSSGAVMPAMGKS